MRHVVLDLGGVILDWNPRHLYRQLLSLDEMEHFLGEICTPAWHLQHDWGTPMAVTIPALCEQFPVYAELIKLWETRYTDMVAEWSWVWTNSLRNSGGVMPISSY